MMLDRDQFFHEDLEWLPTIIAEMILEFAGPIDQKHVLGSWFRSHKHGFDLANCTPHAFAELRAAYETINPYLHYMGDDIDIIAEFFNPAMEPHVRFALQERFHDARPSLKATTADDKSVGLLQNNQNDAYIQVSNVYDSIFTF